MKNETVFTTITLVAGQECKIVEMKMGHYWIAEFKMIVTKENEYPMSAYLMQQILIIDGEKRSLEYLSELTIDDSIAINEVLQALFLKLPK